MGAPADDAVETLHLFRSYLLMFAPLLLIVAAGVGYWMSRRALSPVDELVRTAREVSGANLSSRLQKLETGDELQRLSDTLNEMLDRIEAAFLRVTQFTADASHELRTPVSLIRTEAELALRRSRGEAEYQEALRHILLESERTTMLRSGGLGSRDSSDAACGLAIAVARRGRQLAASRVNPRVEVFRQCRRSRCLRHG
jgi:signal transduction histidine kinase